MTAFLVSIAWSGELSPAPLYDFRRPESHADWLPVNDGVMGGLSSSRIAASDGGAVFEGRVSLENGGGFASVRSAPRSWGLDDSTGLALRLRGDGKRYRLRVKTDGELDGVAYSAPFDTVAGEWITVVVDWAELEPRFRGRRVGASPLDPARVQSFGLMIADRQAGPFRLELAWLAALRR